MSEDRLAAILGLARQVNKLSATTLHEIVKDDVPWLVHSIDRYRAELERIAACEPAHRDRLLRVLAGGEERS